MKEKFQNLTQKVKKEYLAFSTAVMFAASGVMPVCAAPNDVDPAKLVGDLIGIVCSIFRYIGILLLVWGIGQLVLAFKNEDADSKSRAMMLIVASIVLMSVKTLVTALNLGITIGNGF